MCTRTLHNFAVFVCPGVRVTDVFRVPERERQLAMHMLGPEGITSDRVMRHNIRAHAERDGSDSADVAALAMLGIEERADTPPHGDGHALATTSEDVSFEAEEDTDTCPPPSERNWWCLLTSNPSTCVTAQHVERDGGSVMMEHISHPVIPVFIDNDLTTYCMLAIEAISAPPPGWTARNFSLAINYAGAWHSCKLSKLSVC